MIGQTISYHKILEKLAKEDLLEAQPKIPCERFL